MLWSVVSSSSSQETASNLRILARLFAVAWEHRRRCAALLAVQVLLLGLNVVGLGWSGVALDTVHHALDPSAAAPRLVFGLQQLSAASAIAVIAAAVLAIGLLRTWLNYHYAVGVADLVQGCMVPAIRARVYEKLQSLSFRFFDRHDSGSLLNRVTSDVQALRSFVDAVLIQALVMLLALGIYGAYMFRRHAGLTLLCLATTPLLWVVTARFSRRVLPAYQRSRACMDELILGVSEMVQGVQVIKGSAAETNVLAEFAAKNAAVRDGQRTIFRQLSRYTPSVDLLVHTNVVCLLLCGALLVRRGQLSVGDLVVFAGLLQQFSSHVTNMSTIVSTLQESLTGARRVFEVLDAPAEVVSPARPRQLAAAGALRFEHVSFGYEPGRMVLHDLDFTVQPGQWIALFGAAGAGKSTLLSLIPRFYDVSAGRICIDGCDVRELDLAALRRSSAVVFQETFLFSHTVAANIAFGHPQASAAQIERAARIACAHEFIARLPHGYDTLLGEDATNLSGGQRQRLAIARAILSDPRILLLDDPTAALDAETALDILSSLTAAAAGRTTFLVTHRPALLRQADRILVLERGRIVQAGRHAELCNTPGPYRDALRLHEAESSEEISA
jgi:ABC-type multidrug transport system fused ATPase/permease subunit